MTCEHDKIDQDFDTLGNIVTCPDCGCDFKIHYDETYDEETNEEWGWFYLEEVLYADN